MICKHMMSRRREPGGHRDSYSPMDDTSGALRPLLPLQPRRTTPYGTPARPCEPPAQNPSPDAPLRLTVGSQHFEAQTFHARVSDPGIAASLRLYMPSQRVQSPRVWAHFSRSKSEIGCGKKLRPGTLGKIKVIRLMRVPKKSLSKNI